LNRPLLPEITSYFAPVTACIAVQDYRTIVARVIDLSATPFFLSGSGYAEGTLFPWTLSDFSLMDAIECGIVQLPPVPVADNIPGAEMPMFRNLWEHIGKQMPKNGRDKDMLDPLSLPPQLQTALAIWGCDSRWTKNNVSASGTL
jgi:hypothetical protein